jgi:hypothetical protein
MSNHAYVKTRKFMKVELLHQFFDDLNKNYFKNVFKINYEKGDEYLLGPGGWTLTYSFKDKDNKITHEQQVECWLNTSRSFEMKHSAGGFFFEWVDALILHMLAVKFNGKISDDGLNGSWEGDPEKINTFSKYYKKSLNKFNYLFFLSKVSGEIPHEFIDDLK